jgi:small-conductance mechanosensitive channel
VNRLPPLLIADLIWQLAKAYIEFRLELTGQGSRADELPRNGRLRTLLPIFRNALAVFIAVVAVLTILASLGIQIMPLIAGPASSASPSASARRRWSPS